MPWDSEPSSKGSSQPNPGIEPMSPKSPPLAGGFFCFFVFLFFLPLAPPGKPSKGTVRAKALRPDSAEPVKEQQELSMATLAKRVGELQDMQSGRGHREI